MAVFKSLDYLQQSTHPAFDAATVPGKVTPYTGIFRCTVCGREIAAESGTVLPGNDHHAHGAGQGGVQWLLVVAAN
jgi:hypothetical protein